MKKKLIVWIEEDTVEKLKEIAVNSKRSLSSTTCQLIEQSLSPIQSGIIPYQTDPRSFPSASDPLERNSLSSDRLEKLDAFLSGAAQLLEDAACARESSWMVCCGTALEWLRSDGTVVEKQEQMGCDYSYFKKHRLPPGPKGWKPSE